MTDKINVVMAEDNEYFCLTLEAALSDSEVINFVGYRHSIDDFKNLVISNEVDIALLDLDLTQNKDGILILQWLLQNHPHVKSIIITVNENEIAECYKIGARGYILKSNLDNLVDTIKMVHQGSLIIPPGISDLLIEQMKTQSVADSLKLEFKKYSEREVEIINFLKNDYSRKKIADELCISEFTIKRHISNIIQKSPKDNIKDTLEYFHSIL